MTSWRRTGCVIAIATALLGLAGCSTAEPATAGESAADDGATALVARADWASFFESEAISDATFALHEIGSQRTEVYNETRAREPMTPASTFKILNSMIILETGVMPDVDTVVQWDGINRSPGWNRDHSLRSGIEVSAVWAFAELADQVGSERMQQWVDAAAYGNQNIGGSIDSFWIDGELRISALQQVEFLAQFETGELPFRDETIDSVQEILVQESGPGWSWSYKTGLSAEADPDLAWLVGIVNGETANWVFAMNFDLDLSGDEVDLGIRQAVARRLLEAEAVLPTP